VTLKWTEFIQYRFCFEKMQALFLRYWLHNIQMLQSNFTEKIRTESFNREKILLMYVISFKN